MWCNSNSFAGLGCEVMLPWLFDAVVWKTQSTGTASTAFPPVI